MGWIYLCLAAYDFLRNELAPMPGNALDMVNFVSSNAGYIDPSGIVAGMQMASLFNIDEIKNGSFYGMVNGLGDVRFFLIL